jgi:hypothetical protein
MPPADPGSQRKMRNSPGGGAGRVCENTRSVRRRALANAVRRGPKHSPAGASSKDILNFSAALRCTRRPMSHAAVPSATRSSSVRLVTARSPKRPISPATASTLVEPFIAQVRFLLETQSPDRDSTVPTAGRRPWERSTGAWTQRCVFLRSCPKRSGRVCAATTSFDALLAEGSRLALRSRRC